MKKITVVTVAYNAVSLLKKTLESSIIPIDAEYIVIDGNSNDGTQKYLKEFQSLNKIHDFSYISQPDKGVYDAMNKAANMAKGEYILYMNAGDLFYDENTLNNVMAHIKDNNRPDIVYGDHLLFDDSKSKYCKAKPLKNLWKRMVFSHQSMYVKTELQKKFAFDYKNLSADHTFIYTLFSRGFRFSYIQQPLARYLDGGLSIKHYRQSIKHRFLAVLNQTKGFFKKFKVTFYYLLIWFFEPEKYKIIKLLKK